jgi:homospermidine synthase
MIEFGKRILFVGYGAVAQCTLPILVKQLRVSPKQITVMDFEDRRKLLAPWLKKGVQFARKKVTRENMG